MSKILIDTYRGFDITFDTIDETFQCICTDEKRKESFSYSAVKKYIDEYKKINQDFKPFWIMSIPTKNSGEDLFKVIGLRKDGRFIVEKEDGKKEQLPDYYLSDYMLVKPENETALNKMKELITKEKQQKTENDAIRMQIISEINIVTLKEYKSSLL